MKSLATFLQASTHRLACLLCTCIFLANCALVDPNRLTTRVSSATALPETPVPIPLPPTQWRAAALDFVWNTVNERYYDPKFNGADWLVAKEKYRPLLSAATSDEDFWELLDKMTGELKDSHTRVHSPKQVDQEKKAQSHSLGIGLREIDGQLIVTSVHPQSDAFWAGARAGMGITTVDDQPALRHYQTLLASSRESSTPWARTRGAVRKIVAGDVGSEVSMRFIRRDHSEFSATMKRRSFATSTEVTHRVLPFGFGYLRFSGFVGRLEATIIAEIQKMKDTPGMIIDLRGNGGGSAAMAANLISQFLVDSYRGTKLLTRTGKPISIFWIPVASLDPVIEGVGARAYTKPVVILTNESSASASEIFAMTLRDAKRATLIGERSCGCLLAYMGLADIPGGGQLAYSEMGFVNRDGSRVEGSGLLPDIEVSAAREDIVLSRDRALERAIEYLTEKSK